MTHIKYKHPNRKKDKQMTELNVNDLTNVAGGASKGGSKLPDTYKVVAGDNLSTIAAKFNTTWQKLYALNKDLIIKDAKSHGVKDHFENYIYPGQVLKLK